MKDIIFCILTTDKNHDRRTHMQNTWLKNEHYIFYSDAEGKNTIKVTDDNTYKSAEEKQINILNYLIEIKNNIKFEWICFCDDDTYIFVNNLKKEIKNLDKNIVYGQVIDITTNPENPIFKTYPNLKYLSGGAGFLISLHALSNMEKFKHYDSGYSDVSVGLNLEKMNVKIEHNDKFNSQYYNFYTKDIKNQISYHYVNEKQKFDFLYKINEGDL